jgi:hypothetical protein
MVNSRGLARLATVAVGLGIGVAVASTPGVARADDFQISIDGMDLFSTTGNTASAYSGSGDFAIAYGDGAIASAQGGTGDFALAYGSGAYAGAGGIGSDTGADDDTAIDIGTNTGLRDDGAFAGNGDLDGLGGGTGNGDTAIDVGNNTGGYGGPWAVDGNDNYAGVFGDDTGDEGAVAGTGDGNIAEVVGLNNYADAVEGNNNIAYVFDPSGTDGSEANAGYNGSSDLAAVFGDDLSSTYTQGHSDWFDILTPSGDFPGSVGPLLAELLSLF